MDAKHELQLWRWLTRQSMEDRRRVIEDVFGHGAYEKLITSMDAGFRRDQIVWRKGTTTEAAAEIAAKRMRGLAEATRMRRLPDGTKRKKIQGRYFLMIKKLRTDGFSWGLIAEYLKRHHSLKVTPRYLEATFTEALVSYQCEDICD